MRSLLLPTRAGRHGLSLVFLLPVFFATSIILAPLAYALPQVSSGTVRGIVRDKGAKPIPAAISIENVATRETRSAITDKNGNYAVQLTPGHYRISANAQGFAASVADIHIITGDQRVLDFALAVGTQTEGSATAKSARQSGDTALGGVADSKAVRELPSNGRDWTQAATLQAGVAAVRTQPDAGNTNSGRGQRGFGAQITVSGGRPQQNRYVVDGITVNDYANSAPGSVLGLDLGAEAVQQLSVVTSNYPAEIGRSSGGIINAVTHSGTNDFHGSIYEFLRNSALDAKNYFDQRKPPFRRNQFGASLGGPIQPEKTFFFVNYEGLRQSLGVTRVDTVPSAAARAGNLSTGAVVVDPQATRYLAFFPLPNGALLAGGDSGVFTFSGQQVTPENYWTTRIDHRLNDKDTLTGTYAFDSARTTQPDQLDVRLNAIETRRQLVSLQEQHSFNSHVLNAAHAGINRVVALIGQTPQALNPLAADTSFGFLPGHTVGSINVLGLTNFTGGLGAASPFSFHWTSIQAADDVALLLGRHTVRFGGAFERMRDNMLANTDPNGVFTFHSLSDFLTNRPFSLSVALPGNAIPRDLRQSVLGLYFSDDVRFRPNLTMNLGLRYETASVPNEVAGRLASLRNITDATAHVGNPYFANPTRLNFEPRVGIAWDPLGKGRFNVRAGFGTFDVLPLPYEFELLSLFAAPFFRNATPSALPQGTFPFGAVGIAQTANLFRNVYIEPTPSRNYVNQWNLGIEFQVAQSSTLLLAYVGSSGVHQPFRADDINMVLPSLIADGYVWPVPAGSGTKINPAVGRLDGLFWKGASNYNALQVRAHTNLGHGADVQTSYTWGKSLDTGSATIAGDQFANSVSSLPWFDLHLNRGPSDFNIAHVLSVHLTYEPLAAGTVHAWYASGWRVTGTLQASTGAPFTLAIGGDPLGELSTDPFDVPDRIAGPGCDTAVNPGNPINYVKLQCFAVPTPATRRGSLSRNSLQGPGLLEADIALFKDNYIKRISERFNVQLRAEAFNVFNRANFSPPLSHRSIFDQTGNVVPGAGLIDSTATTSRQLQFGLKLMW